MVQQWLVNGLMNDECRKKTMVLLAKYTDAHQHAYTDARTLSKLRKQANKQTATNLQRER